MMSIARVFDVTYKRFHVPSQAVLLWKTRYSLKMPTPQKKKESLSLAYIRAVAAKAGVNVATFENDFGIDLTLRQVSVRNDSQGTRYVDNGSAIDIQAKCSEKIEIESQEVVYDLEAKTYNDLVQTDVANPRILVIMRVPHAENEWLKQSHDELVIKNCAYWISLLGKEPTENSQTIRIRIPITQQFTPEAIIGLFERVNVGDDL